MYADEKHTDRKARDRCSKPRLLSAHPVGAQKKGCSRCLQRKNIPLFECSVTVETERQADAALAQIREEGCNALVVYLGNFGPETPETLFRLQSTADAQLRAYVAQDEVLPVATRSFGSIGIIAIPEMARFYRYELIEYNYPHHGAVAFAHIGNTLYELFRYLGVTEIGYNRPKGDRYPAEKPF